MINTQLFHDVILGLAMLIATTLAFTTAMMLAARSAPKPGQTPHGGSRRDLPQDPQPEPDGIVELIPDDIRELVPDDIRELVPEVRELVLR
jgi:hypothetical protein